MRTDAGQSPHAAARVADGVRMVATMTSITDSGGNCARPANFTYGILIF